MKTLLASLLSVMLSGAAFYDFKVTGLDGKDIDFSRFRGKKVLIVNTASKCGNTPQYADLQKLYDKYKSKLVIVGFPANNFGQQEPGTNEEIQTFCKSKFGVTFPMMSKISVVGADKAPLYHYLTEKQTAGDFAGEIGWNFNKFIVDRNGNLIARYHSKVKPDDKMVTEEIEKALEAKPAVAG